MVYKKDKSGFTLIELAMILVIIGVLIGIGVTTLSILIKRAKYAESKEIINSAVDAIIGYSATSGKIPTLSELNNVVRTREDSYGKPIVYIYDRDLTTPSPYGHCGLKTTNINVQICDDPSCATSTTINNVAFIILSGDGNFNNQTGGSREISTPTTVRIYQYGIVVDNYPDDVNRPEPFDDIVKWVTLHELQTKEGCKALTIETPSLLDDAVEDAPYNYKLSAAGGRPPYSWGTFNGTDCVVSATDVNLTAGLKLSSNGSIYGTVNADTSSQIGSLSSCSVTVNLGDLCVKDSAGNIANQQFTINIIPQQLKIITETLPTGYEGSNYNITLRAFGGGSTYTWSLVSGNLPPGLTLNSDGTITGTITSDTGCSNESPYNFTVKVSSCSGSYIAFKAYSITVLDPDCSTAGTGSGGNSNCTPFSLNPPSGTTFNAVVLNPFSQTISLTGGNPPITNVTCLPTQCGGLTLSCLNNGAVISGIPNTATSCTFTVSYKDNCNPQQSITGTYVVNITSPAQTTACTLSPNPDVVPFNSTTNLNWIINSTFTSAYFNPITGNCTTVSSQTGSCTTGNLTTSGINTFTLNISYGVYQASCSTDVYVGCEGYRVYNGLNSVGCYLFNGRVILAGPNSIITVPSTGLLEPGMEIQRFEATCFFRFCTCRYRSNTPIVDTLTYNEAMAADIQKNGGDGDCEVIYNVGGTATDR